MTEILAWFGGLDTIHLNINENGKLTSLYVYTQDIEEINECIGTTAKNWKPTKNALFSDAKTPEFILKKIVGSENLIITLNDEEANNEIIQKFINKYNLYDYTHY